MKLRRRRLICSSRACRKRRQTSTAQACGPYPFGTEGDAARVGTQGLTCKLLMLLPLWPKSSDSLSPSAYIRLLSPVTDAYSR